jgi:DNA excision repair protein ERCC-4
MVKTNTKRIKIQLVVPIYIYFFSATILIMVDEKRTCAQLKEYVSTRSSMPKDSTVVPILSRLARNYFRWKSAIVQINQQAKAELRDKTSTPREGSRQFSPNARGGAPPNKRRRVRGASAIAAASEAFTRPLADTFQQDIADNAEAYVARLQ